MSDTLDKGKQAAEGDLGALKYLFLGLSVVALIAGIAVSLFYTVGENIGEFFRDTAEDAADTVTDGSGGGSSGGYLGGGQ